MKPLIFAVLASTSRLKIFTKEINDSTFENSTVAGKFKTWQCIEVWREVFIWNELVVMQNLSIGTAAVIAPIVAASYPLQSEKHELFQQLLMIANPCARYRNVGSKVK